VAGDGDIIFNVKHVTYYYRGASI